MKRIAAKTPKILLRRGIRDKILVPKKSKIPVWIALTAHLETPRLC
jgi:hypothetical protein